MRIALSCVLLGQRDFLAAHGAGLVSVLCGFIGNVKDRGMLALLPVMDAVVQVGRQVAAVQRQGGSTDVQALSAVGPSPSQTLGVFCCSADSCAAAV